MNLTRIISIILFSTSFSLASAEKREDYGYDISFPMLGDSVHVSTNYPWLPHNINPSIPTPEKYKNMSLQPLGDRESFYQDFIQGCRDYWRDSHGEEICDETDLKRLKHNTQIASMVNYTDLGYQKVRLPSHVFQPIYEFWIKNKDKETDESFFPGSTFINYWNDPSKFVDITREDLPGGGEPILNQLWESTLEIMKTWTGQPLFPSSLYGIRVYKKGSILAPHVDRLPLIASAIINIDQDPDAEPWPLEVIGHDGIARNVTMNVGEMILYESHSLMHGRPFPFQGRYYANLMIHFELDPNSYTGLPPYIQKGSKEANKFLAGEYKDTIPSLEYMKSIQEKHSRRKSHDAAVYGNLDALIRIAKEDPASLYAPDVNGWQPIHEGAREGHVDIVEFLLDQGADINAKTGGGQSVLSIVADFLGKDNRLYKYLRAHGALELGPEL